MVGSLIIQVLTLISDSDFFIAKESLDKHFISVNHSHTAHEPLTRNQNNHETEGEQLLEVTALSHTGRPQRARLDLPSLELNSAAICSG